MPDASVTALGLSIFSASCDAGSVLKNITQNVSKLLQTRDPLAHRCQLLRNEAEFLARLMDELASSQDPTGREGVSSLIRNIDEFVQRVTTGSWVVMFVTGEMEYQALREQCRRFQDAFSLEMMTITYMAQQRERNALCAGSRRIQTSLELQSGMSAKLQDIKYKEREQLPAPRATMTLDSSTIKVDDLDLSIRRGILESRSIECRKVSDTTATRRALAMYQDLQYGAYVQVIHGVAKIDEDKYIVMQDCSHLLTLAKACKSGSSLSDLSEINRIQLAFNVAQSISWLHAGELVLKTLNDASILLETKDGAMLPCITGLEHIRLFSEKTNRARVDVRYEAPETQSMRKHTKESDVWCLGIIIWQILTGKVPYSLSEPVDVNDVSKAADIRGHLSENRSPTEDQPSIHEDLVELISRCWLPASLRPRSKTVADTLLRFQLKLCSKSTGNPTTCEETQGVYDNTSGSGADREQLNDAKNLALGAIERVRTRKSEWTGDVPSEKLETKHAEILMKYSDHPLYPECAFLVGAAIWWGLLDIWLVKRFVPHQAKTTDGLRAENALSYLAVASGRGHTDAYFEMSKAYAALYREYKPQRGRVKE